MIAVVVGRQGEIQGPFETAQDVFFRAGEIATRQALERIYGVLPLYKRVLRLTRRFKSRKDENTDQYQERPSGE